MTPEEFFLCRNLDGQTDLKELKARFEKRFDKQIPLPQLKAFARNLAERGLLNHSKAPSDDQLRVLPVNANRLFAHLHLLLGWTCSYPARALFLLVIAAGIGVLVQNWNEIFFPLSNLVDLIVAFGMRGGPLWQTWMQVLLILVIIPMLREIQKGVACHHFGIPTADIRYGWLLFFIPLFFTNIGSIMMPRYRSRRMRVVTIGIELEATVLATALVGWALMPYYQPEKEFFYSVALAAAISLLLNTMPLGKRDGSQILATWLGIPDFRRRAVAISRAWLTFRTAPEALPSATLRLFRWYGLFADLYQLAIILALLGLLGYLLVTWLDGLGALIFLVLLILTVSSHVRSKPMAAHTSTRKKIGKWAIGLGVAALLVTIGMMPYTKEVSGEFRVRPIDQREVRAEVVSQVARVEAKEGDWVEQGQLLVQLTKRFIEKDLDTATAALNREEAVLRDLQAGPKPEAVAEAEQQVRISEIEVVHAQRTFSRAEDLHAEKQISEADYDRAKEKMELAQGTLELRRRNLALVRSGATKEEMEAQEAEVQRLLETIKHLENDLRLTTVTSPISGQVTSLSLEALKGQTVLVGDVVAKVADTSTINLRISVPEKHIDLVKIGARVQARAWAFPDMLLEGNVSHISPVVVDKTEDMRIQAEIEQETGLVRSLNAPMENVVPVLVQAANPDGRLKIDMSGYAKIEAGTTAAATAFLDPLIRFVKVMVWSWLP